MWKPFFLFVGTDVRIFAAVKPKIVNEMMLNKTEFVISNLKGSYYKGWEKEKLEECKELLRGMTLEELRSVRHSRWMKEDNALYPTLFELLYSNELQEVVRKLNLMTTPELIKELRETKSSYKKDKIPQILLERYDSMEEKERKAALKILQKKELITK